MHRSDPLIRFNLTAKRVFTINLKSRREEGTKHSYQKSLAVQRLKN